ncbi:MAG: M61 family metallopeptidase [Sphingomonadales bacterium]|nr:M61 family metallopeptidase [Sphingomonadales bacterium]
MSKNILKITCYSAAFALFSAAPVLAQNSAPTITPIISTIPDPVDTAPPGPMILEVDASDITRAIYRVKQRIAVDPDKPVILLYPEWLPGKHGPRGALAELTGLTFRADGKPVTWTRDPVEVYAFHINAPKGTRVIDAEFQFLTPIRGSEGRRVITPEMMNVQWEQVALYPAGHFTRAIRVRPSIKLPAGWTGIAALDGAQQQGDILRYGETDFETLVDSPMFAGRHYQKWDLGQNVSLNVWADEAKHIDAAKPEHIAAHKALVDETIILFGSKHFDRYEFLLALTEELGGIGLEHHRSSENTRGTDYFSKWDNKGSERGLLPHELVHSWNGKFRRSDVMWTPDYRTPMQDNMLWLYEGQTSYWDLVLAGRSGIQTKEVVLADWARSAAYYSVQPGRQWRSVEDTTHDPIFAARKPKPNSSWSRGEDYYNEGSLVWLDTDMTIRQLSGGKKSLDDFAKAFFGINDGDWGTVTYDFDDVVRTLNAVQPYDWATFLDKRLRQAGAEPPLGGIEKGGYRLVFKETPNIVDKERTADNGSLDLTYSLGMYVDKNGNVESTLWDGEAFRQGIITGSKIVAVNDMSYSNDRMTGAIAQAKDGKTSIRLIVERDKRFRNVEMSYTGGLRYPHLEPVSKGEQPLDKLLLPRRK